MKLGKFVKWALQQGLGTKRGQLLTELLTGPLGVLIDLLAEGRPQKALEGLGSVTDALLEAAQRAGAEAPQTTEKGN